MSLSNTLPLGGVFSPLLPAMMDCACFMLPPIGSGISATGVVVLAVLSYAADTARLARVSSIFAAATSFSSVLSCRNSESSDFEVVALASSPFRPKCPKLRSPVPSVSTANSLRKVSGSDTSSSSLMDSSIAFFPADGSDASVPDRPRVCCVRLVKVVAAF